jgi:threonine synthase
MNYISTKGNYPPVDSATAIKFGMVPRGGLFVPESIPAIDFDRLRGMDYGGVAYEILRLFLTDFSEEELKDFIAKAYNGERFDSSRIVPLHFLDDNTSILELWHGPTAAFKDLALQIMPHFLTTSARKLKSSREIVILVATSGDTGKAALEGFKDVPGTRIIVFYPKNGVSDIQRLQMVTTGGNNTSVVAVDGNFDDCQNMVKSIFADTQYNAILNNHGFELSSANSINWGRLVPQIIYYFWAYLGMVEKRSVFIGEEINIAVPTGNFGNILAAYYAYRMGLPVKTLICASNINKVLTDFFESGIYDKNREFFKTSSPSMDILISSNLERFLYEISGHNALKIQRWYNELVKDGRFKVDQTTAIRMTELFVGGFADEKETFDEIKRVFDNYGYLVDTHTAVGINVYRRFREESGDNTPTVIASTASPFKFNKAVYRAVTGDDSIDDEFALLEKLSEIGKMDIHRAVDGLKDAEIRHKLNISTDEGRRVIKEILNIK